MKRDTQKTNWIIDAALFGGFLGSLWLDLTGVPVHQWLGLAVGAVSGYHLVAHWKWVKAVTGRFFGRTSSQSRIYYLMDAGLAAGFAAILGTGLVISTWLDLLLASYAAWHTVHVAASVGTLALLVTKIGLHWRWIAGVARRSIFPAPAASKQTGALQPTPVAARIDRRDFMRLMAGVGAVAVLAGTDALGSLTEGQTEAFSATQATASTPIQVSIATSTTGSCTVRCNRGCSYPGHCGKYTDSNNNGRCDLGECLT